jgi:hypothetical protein
MCNFAIAGAGALVAARQSNAGPAITRQGCSKTASPMQGVAAA